MQVLTGLQDFEHSRYRTVVEESFLAAILLPFPVCCNVWLRVARYNGASCLCRLCDRDQRVGAVGIRVGIFCRWNPFVFNALDYGGAAITR